MPKKKLPQAIEECNAELERTQKLLQQYENRNKMLNRKLSAEKRKERNHRIFLFGGFMAERKLKSYFKDGKLPITAWRREREQLEQEYKDIQTELSPLHADAKKLWAIHYNIYEVQREQERQNTATRQKKQEIER